MAALIGTAFSAMLLVLTAMNAGPLWRDETNTFNLAHMPSLRDIWHNLPFDSCPLLWPLLVRGCGMLGLTNSDMGIRILGLGIGLFFLASLWLCQRWIGGRTPILSIALLGGLPAFIFVVGDNRAYGLASCLLVLSFGTIWRVLESPTKSRIILAGFICLLFTQCVYYDVIFLGAMLAAGALVAIRRQQWKIRLDDGGHRFGGRRIFVDLFADLLISFRNTCRSGARHSLTLQPFGMDSATLWPRGAVPTLRVANGPQIWIWITLLLAGIIVAIVMQRTRVRQTPKPELVFEECQPRAVRPGTVLCHQRGSGNHCVFWVPAEIAVFHAAMVLRRNPGPLRYLPGRHLNCELAGAPSVGAVAHWLPCANDDVERRPAWVEAHTRRSNLDLVAAFLSQNASAGDLIVVQNAWEGITFNRYYRGQAQWLSVPPINSHEVHRIDLVMAKMNQPGGDDSGVSVR